MLAKKYTKKTAKSHTKYEEKLYYGKYGIAAHGTRLDILISYKKLK